MSTEPAAKRPRWTYDLPCTTMEHTERSTPSISLQADEKSTESTDLVLVGVYGSGEEISASKLGFLEDETIREALATMAVESKDFFQHGKKLGVTTPMLRMITGRGKPKRYALTGLGKKPTINAVGWGGGLGIKLGSAIVSVMDTESKSGCKSALVYLPNGILTSEVFLFDLSSSLYQSLYSDNRYRSGENIKIPAKGMERLIFASQDGTVDATAFNASIQDGLKLARAQYLTMDIVNSPHNVMNSISLANEARALAEHSSTLTCTILGKAECEKRKMGAYLAVSRGAETEPQFIHLTYKPSSGEIKRRVGIVGKGVMFDTGGYNIKTSMMELMKFDCGGGAAVVGAAKAIAALEPPGVEAHFIVAACSNMINAKAYVPSDVLTASNGKTIEVMNTDAEGRLTLADALVYADKEADCEKIMELSTLTGSCMVSLGKQICGVWTGNDALAREVEQASLVTGEKSWRMPLAKEYQDQLESKIADMTNCGNRWGGAITAALFLQNFVSDGKPFVHLDIAGPVWNDRLGRATGFGVKLVAEWVRQQGK